MAQLTVREVRGLLFGHDTGTNTIRDAINAEWARPRRNQDNIRALELIDEMLLIKNVRHQLFEYDEQDVPFTGLYSDPEREAIDPARDAGRNY